MKTEKKAESASALAERADAAKRKLADATADARRLKNESRQAKAAVKKAKKAAKAATRAARAAKKTMEEARRASKKAVARVEKARAKAGKANAGKKIAKAKRRSAPITTPRKSARPRNVAPRKRAEPSVAHADVDFEASFSDTDLKELGPQ